MLRETLLGITMFEEYGLKEKNGEKWNTILSKTNEIFDLNETLLDFEKAMALVLFLHLDLNSSEP